MEKRDAESLARFACPAGSRTIPATTPEPSPKTCPGTHPAPSGRDPKHSAVEENTFTHIITSMTACGRKGSACRLLGCRHAAARLGAWMVNCHVKKADEHRQLQGLHSHTPLPRCLSPQCRPRPALADPRARGKSSIPGPGCPDEEVTTFSRSLLIRAPLHGFWQGIIP